LDGDSRIAAARIVLGAVAPTPWRARASEAALIGRRPDATTLDAAAWAWIAAAHPLPLNGWKLDATAGLLRRVLARAAATTHDQPRATPRHAATNNQQGDGR
jgi:xanthine dehydrogenase YagS FAD-binding subunit